MLTIDINGYALNPCLVSQVAPGARDETCVVHFHSGPLLTFDMGPAAFAEILNDVRDSPFLVDVPVSAGGRVWIAPRWVATMRPHGQEDAYVLTSGGPQVLVRGRSVEGLMGAFEAAVGCEGEDLE